jgi:hypothetical protein
VKHHVGKWATHHQYTHPGTMAEFREGYPFGNVR